MASALEQFVNTVRNLSSQGTWHKINAQRKHGLLVLLSGNYRELAEYVGKSNDLLLKNAPLLDNVLETLDLQQHSLGFLAVIAAKFNLPVSGDQDDRFKQTYDFIVGCNGEQIRLAPDLCKYFLSSYKMVVPM